MRAATLHKAEFDTSHLHAVSAVDEIGKLYGKSAELGMTEIVLRFRARKGFDDEYAVLVADTFGHAGDTFAAVIVHYSLDVREEFLHGERNFGKVNKVGAQSFIIGKRRRGGKPARVSSHYLYDSHLTFVVDFGVEVKLHERGRHVLRGAAVSGAVVGAVEVVVDGFRNADDVTGVTRFHKIFAYLVAGIHTVVAAVIEEIADIVLLENLEYPLVIGIVHGSVFKFVSHRTEARRRSVLEEQKLVHIFLSDIVKVLFQDTFDAVSGTVNGGYVLLLEGFDKYARGRSVDDRSRSAGLSENTCAD